MAFEFYDFDKDGYICEEDVSLVLSYADIHHKDKGDEKDENEEAKEKAKRKRSQSPSHSFEDRLANQMEIAKITEKMFDKKSKLNFDNFKEFNTNVGSETILCVLKSLKQHIPCTDNFYKYLKEYRTTMKTRSQSPPDEFVSSPIASPTSKTFKATSPSSTDIKTKSFLFEAAKKEKGSKYMKDLVGDEKSTKEDTASLTKEEIEEKVAKNAAKLKNPKILRKERLQRQETIKEDEGQEEIGKKAIRMKNITKLKIDTSKCADQTFTSEIQSPTRFFAGEESKVSKICT